MDIVLEKATRWLASFNRLLQGDASEAASLFTIECYWRDLLAITGTMRTVSGVESIIMGLNRIGDGSPTAPECVLSRDFPPASSLFGGRSVIEVFAELDIPVGRVIVLARLIEEPGEEDPRCWTLMTSLEELGGVHETVGEHRPEGYREFGGKSWLDLRRESEQFDGVEPEVLVVGGGQSGLMIAARLTQLGVSSLVVERTQGIGDVWRNRYKSLTLHNEIWANQLPYMKYPDSFPVYIPKDKFANWLSAYADSMELNCWTNTDFLHAERLENEGRWLATVRRGGEDVIVRPRHIVMAIGVSGIPNVPSVPGDEVFDGSIIHSSEYKGGECYAGKNVIVFGAGNSAHDIAQDLYLSGANVTMVQRSSTTVVSLESAAKLHAVYGEESLLRRSDLLSASVPQPVQKTIYQAAALRAVEDDAELLAGLEKIGFKTDIGEDGTGFQMKYFRRGGGYYINVGCSELLAEGKIGFARRSEVDRLLEHSLRLVDGRELPADLIVLATGYQGLESRMSAWFGEAIASRVGAIWGVDENGEVVNAWRKTAQDGLWFMLGSLFLCRIYSHYLALQIVAEVNDLDLGQLAATG